MSFFILKSTDITACKPFHLIFLEQEGTIRKTLAKLSSLSFIVVINIRWGGGRFKFFWYSFFFLPGEKYHFYNYPPPPLLDLGRLSLSYIPPRKYAEQTEHIYINNNLKKKLGLLKHKKKQSWKIFSSSLLCFLFIMIFNSIVVFSGAFFFVIIFVLSFVSCVHFLPLHCMSSHHYTYQQWREYFPRPPRIIHGILSLLQHPTPLRS